MSPQHQPPASPHERPPQPPLWLRCAAALLLGLMSGGAAGFCWTRRCDTRDAPAAPVLVGARPAPASPHTDLLAAEPGGALHGPSTANAGSSIVVTVGSNDSVVESVDPSTGEITAQPVGADRRVTVPAPAHAGVLLVRVGSGARARVLRIEILAPSP